VGQRIECNRNRENREKIFELVETLWLKKLANQASINEVT
jgi:hypothetical protein